MSSYPHSVSRAPLDRDTEIGTKKDLDTDRYTGTNKDRDTDTNKDIDTDMNEGVFIIY